MTFAIAYDVTTQATSSSVAPRLPLMSVSATFTIEVSISSIIAAAMTVMVRMTWRRRWADMSGREPAGFSP